MAATNFPGQFPLGARRARITEVWEQPARPARSNVIPVGARVFHQKFGYGTVTAVENDRLDVTFEKAGEKHVLDRYVAIA
jgi:DNA helicase-2/ATP-dependent DNA helicase PcrA